MWLPQHLELPRNLDMVGMVTVPAGKKPKVEEGSIQLDVDINITMDQYVDGKTCFCF
jgi:hypothetical protein